ncbi:winged helix-turn-helix domain-containing protein [Serratia sp. DD3]|uniref:winged helix-turn-helix domain-containing protein n=1 Tax=Serratia sp. DD3 TaxID=1410619 RepID=UPI001F45AD96|nr:winged helix-turn-helix domain-containing protein [Serratia sp. DD3]
MKGEIYGFLIDEEILFDINKKRLIRFSDDTELRAVTISAVSLSVNLVRLLTLLLTSEKGVVVSKNDILNNVWEDNNLSSSSQRLWHAINELRRKLMAMGLSSDFISSVRDSGYFINNHKVTPLFYG